MKTPFKISAILLTVSLTSCSTIFRTKTQTINVFSNADKAQITVNDSVYALPAKIKLLRGKKPLTLSYQSNNKQFDTVVLPKSGPLFYLGNIVTSPLFGVGYWVDLTNKKRYQYKKNIFLNDKDGLEIYEYKADKYIAKREITDSLKQVEILEKIKKHEEATVIKKQKNDAIEFKRFNPTAGTFRFNIQPPTLFLMGFSSKNTNVDYFSNSVGGMGFGFGGDYYYSNKRFFSMELSHRINQFHPPYVDTSYDFLANNLNLSIRKGHRLNRIEYSYGLSFSFFSSEYSKNNRSFQDDYKTIGFSTLFNYQLTSVMYIGIRYNPSVYNFKSIDNGFDYGHIIGIDYRLKF
ncbi:hypothetical protein NU10_08200 [Flavobacterium dauae]|uniref:hypothetical protein n=1 Tax=Flavobacterium dauae TaxID=1563479 RepID=UPI00101B2BA5|nr:hypothetical protein [Flavobacterium dauae]WLD22707.1 hypothetical protein NU10_08200 [Flavobacterium dauae]